jgi:hypothetical protein
MKPGRVAEGASQGGEGVVQMVPGGQAIITTNESIEGHQAIKITERQEDPSNHVDLATINVLRHQGPNHVPSTVTIGPGEDSVPSVKVRVRDRAVDPPPQGAMPVTKRASMIATTPRAVPRAPSAAVEILSRARNRYPCTLNNRTVRPIPLHSISLRNVASSTLTFYFRTKPMSMSGHA